MANEVRDELIVRAAGLANGPHWASFMQAFAAHVDRIYEECVDAAPANVATAQGRAKHAKEMFDLFRECVPNSAKILGSRGSK